MWTLIILLLASGALARKTGGGGGRTGHGTHSYPHSTGYSGTGYGGSHTYPGSTGYSGNNHVPKHQNNYNTPHKTEVHNHYHNHHYSPPQQIGYGSHSYPVYHGTPPVYVYQYRDSGSRFDTLLTGLALYNLGRMSAHHSSYNNYGTGREYRGTPGEMCKLGIRKGNGDYEESRVDCHLMSSFIYESSPAHVTDQQSEHKTITSSSTVTQVTNGTNGTSTTTTVTNTTVVDALKAKGESIKVTPEMTCYLIRTAGYDTMKKTIECGLLQTYAQRSWNSANRFKPVVIMFVFQMFLFQVM